MTTDTPTTETTEPARPKRNGPPKAETPVEEELLTAIGAAVNARRETLGLTQAAAAAAAGMDNIALSRIIRGMVNPTVLTLARVADALGCDLVVTFKPQPGRAKR